MSKFTTKLASGRCQSQTRHHCLPLRFHQTRPHHPATEERLPDCIWMPYLHFN